MGRIFLSHPAITVSEGLARTKEGWRNLCLAGPDDSILAQDCVISKPKVVSNDMVYHREYQTQNWKSQFRDPPWSLTG